MLKISKKQLNLLIENFLLLENEVEFKDRKFLLIRGKIRESKVVYEIIINNPEVKALLFQEKPAYLKIPELKSKIVEIAYNEHGLTRSIGRKRNSKNLDMLLNVLVKDQRINSVITSMAANPAGDYYDQQDITKDVNNIINMAKGYSHSEKIKKGMIDKPTKTQIDLDDLIRAYQGVKIKDLKTKITDKFKELGEDKQATEAYIKRYIETYNKQKKVDSKADHETLDSVTLALLSGEDEKAEYDKSVETYEYETPTRGVATLTFYPGFKGKEARLVMMLGDEKIEEKTIAKDYKAALLKEPYLPKKMEAYINTLEVKTKSKYNPSQIDFNIKSIHTNLIRLKIKDFANAALKPLERNSDTGKYAFTSNLRSAIAKFLKVLIDEGTQYSSLMIHRKDMTKALTNEIALQPTVITQDQLAVGASRSSQAERDKLGGADPWKVAVIEITGIEDPFAAAARLISGFADIYEKFDSQDYDQSGGDETIYFEDFSMFFALLGEAQ